MEQSLQQKTKQYLEKIKTQDKKINSFLYINPNVLEEAKTLDKKSKKGKLYGKIFGIKSNINVQGFPASCASKTLENYISTYDATVIKKLKEEDSLIIGMTNMDEFASGSSGESSAFGATKNPKAPDKIPGGSSSGSAAAIASKFCDITLGSDTGGSIRNPASHCGVIGYKPSYGLVSRYGLIDLSMSLDQIGPLAKTIEEIRDTINVIKGKDEKDTTTFESKPFKKFIPKNITIGILRVPNTNPKIQSHIDKKINSISKKLKWKTKNIDLKHINLAVQTYYPLVYSEFFSATRRFDGRRYGKKIEEASGNEVLRRILGGSEITKAEFSHAYYEKALQVKELIKEEFEQVFKVIDCIMLPTVPSFPWDIGQTSKMSPEEIYASDSLTAPVNLSEGCAISIPSGTINNIPIGLQIICNKHQDELLLNIAEKAESVLDS